MTTTAAPGSGLSLRGISKSFRTPRSRDTADADRVVHAVRRLDLDIAAGETVALLGPNGAGKSTAIDMVLGLSDPDEGEVRVFGRSPRDAIARGTIGAMLQVGGLLPDLTVREMISMLAAVFPTPLPVDEVLERTGLTEFAGRRTDKLSGGQTQRVRFALALVSNPDLLVLDEPTVAMDVKIRHDFWMTMRGFAADGRTVVFATHYLEEADLYADRIVLMAQGRIVADGSASEIKARVGQRTLTATLPGVDLAALGALPGVATPDRRGDQIVLRCTDSDATVRALLDAYPTVRDLEIQGAGLEDAFLQLTADEPDATTTSTSTGAPR